MAVVAWPPPTPPNNRQNNTLELDNHPSDHNRIADALDTLIARVGTSTELAFAESTTAQTGIQTTTIDLTGLTITFTLATPRRVLIVGEVWYTKAAPDTSSMGYLQISTGANSQQQGGGLWVPAPGLGRVHIEKRLSLIAGTFTYKLRGATGAGFINTAHSVVETGFIQARDLGT